MTQTSFAFVLSRGLNQTPNAPALVFSDAGGREQSFTFARLFQLAGAFQAVLAQNKVGPNDRVVLCLPKSPAAVALHLAILASGAAAIHLSTRFTPDEFSYFFSDAAPVLVAVSPDQAKILAPLAAPAPALVIDPSTPLDRLDLLQGFFDAGFQVRPVDPGTPAMIVYTSGTTGRPKGAVLTHENLSVDADRIIRTWKITDKDRLIHALPLFHVHGLCFALHTFLAAGGFVRMMEKFDPRAVIRVFGVPEPNHSSSVFMAVPAMYALLLAELEKNPADLSGLRLITSGSAPLLPKDFRRIEKMFGKPPVEREAMTETGVNFSNPVSGIQKPGSIGLPMPHVRVRIVDPETGADLDPGRTGEIWLKGPGIFSEYLNKPEETARAFDNGWFKSGDLGYVDDDGYYFLTDRLKNIIISGGENISPKEIEGVINRFSGVAESAVVGLPDEKWGEKVVAAIVSREGGSLDLTAVSAHLAQHLHPWKRPKELKLTEKLPKNAMGKILVKEVRRLFATPQKPRQE